LSKKRTTRARTGDSRVLESRVVARSGRGVSAVRSGARRTRRVMKTSELIARDIILDISEGGLKKGDSLPPEAAMLKHYEVGRASLREALRLLEVQGLVHIRAGAKGGPVVGSANAENLARMLTLYFGLAGATYEDLCDVMLILYPRVAEIAARRKLTRTQIVALKDSIDQNCGAPNPRLIRTETLKDFHALLTEFSGNSVWTLLADAVALVFADHIISTIDSRGFHEQAILDHKEIGEAVMSGDVEASSSSMLRHTERMIGFYRSQNPAIFSQLIEWR
jgi:GntR family transcriptional regulator, transcriptional repressor for pyruvate dehydrogenase complex